MFFFATLIFVLFVFTKSGHLSVNLKAGSIHLTLNTRQISLSRSTWFTYKLYQHEFWIILKYLFVEKLYQCYKYWLRLVQTSMYPKTLKHWLVSCEGSLTSWREGASLALVGHPSSNGVTIKLLYVADALHQPALYSIFSYYYLQWFIRKLTEISLR